MPKLQDSKFLKIKKMKFSTNIFKKLKSRLKRMKESREKNVDS